MTSVSEEKHQQARSLFDAISDFAGRHQLHIRKEYYIEIAEMCGESDTFHELTSFVKSNMDTITLRDITRKAVELYQQ